MTRIRLRDPHIPPALHGWLLIDFRGVPRYWSTVWTALEAASLGESTLSSRLAAIEQFYLSVEDQLGDDCLDSLIANLDFNQLESCLEGFFVSLRNRGAQNAGDHSMAWRTVIRFVRDCTDRIARTGSFKIPLDETHSRLLRLERLHNSLNLPQTRRSETVRALPAVVLEELYELIDPTSDRNPFKSESIRWRNFALILLMLHQGLRRGETLVLALDAIKMDFQSNGNGVRYWLDVISNPYETADPRRDNPSLKNANAVRQIPVDPKIANVIETYVSNFRGKQSHSFLFSSQEGRPLSKRSVNDIMDALSSSLSATSTRALLDRRKIDKIHPHALRHTCAVVRLKQLIDAGTEMELAIQKLRVFFGWSRSSPMPQLYARAYFEDRLTSVWRDSFDLHVNALRQMQGEVER